METTAKNVSFKSNVYLKLISKTFKPDNTFIKSLLEKEIEKRYAELAVKGEADREFTEEEIEQIKNELLEKNTHYKYQLQKIKPSKLLNFIHQNSDKITKLEMPLLTKDDVFDEIVQDYKLPKGITSLPIYIDSETLLIKILRVSKENLQQMKDNGEINEEEYQHQLLRFNFD